MKLIIAGSRTLYPSTELINALMCDFKLEEITDEIVSGTANGVDKAGEAWQKSMEDICGSNAPKLKLFPADWQTHGKAAGHIRNEEMARYADALLLIWDGESKGSLNMRRQMQILNKPIYEIIIRKK